MLRCKTGRLHAKRQSVTQQAATTAKAARRAEVDIYAVRGARSHSVCPAVISVTNKAA